MIEHWMAAPRHAVAHRAIALPEVVPDSVSFESSKLLAPPRRIPLGGPVSLHVHIGEHQRCTEGINLKIPIRLLAVSLRRGGPAKGILSESTSSWDESAIFGQGVGIRCESRHVNGTIYTFSILRYAELNAQIVQPGSLECRYGSSETGNVYYIYH